MKEPWPVLVWAGRSGDGERWVDLRYILEEAKAGLADKLGWGVDRLVTGSKDQN